MTATPTPQRKTKPWGSELWWANTPKYAGKILEIARGGRLSLQYHRWKMETQLVVSGRLRLTYGRDPTQLRTRTLRPGDVWHNDPGMIHRLEGLAETSTIFEVSTPHLSDVIRLDDDYARPRSGNHAALDARLAASNQHVRSVSTGSSQRTDSSARTTRPPAGASASSRRLNTARVTPAV